MYESQRLITTTPKELIHGIYTMKRDGYRLVQIHCTRVESGFELNYSFDKNYEFITYRIVLPIDETILSISRVFQPAFLYENELKDLFGVKIDDISIDYDGNLYRIAQKTPFKEYVAPQPVISPKPPAKPVAKPAEPATASEENQAAGKEVPTDGKA